MMLFHLCNGSLENLPLIHLFLIIWLGKMSEVVGQLIEKKLLRWVTVAFWTVLDVVFLWNEVVALASFLHPLQSAE